MSLDLEKIRADTPACQSLVHLNNCGASLSPQPVMDAVFAHLQSEQEMGGYEAEAYFSNLIDAFYSEVALMLNASPQEIAYMENATAAWQAVFHAIPFELGDRILTARSEYVSNYISYLKVAQEKGVIVEPVPDDEFGQLDVSALESMIDDRVKLISVTQIPTNAGLVNPVVEIGAIARKHDIFYLVDACQAAGQVVLDVEKIQCDALTATGRKYMRGPRGTGFLYVRQQRLAELTPPFIDLRAATWVAEDRYEFQPTAIKFENWECHVAGKIGLGVAANYYRTLGMQTVEDRIVSLASKFRADLETIPGARVLDGGKKKGGIVSFLLDGKDPLEIKASLQKQKINLTTTNVSSTRLNMQDKMVETANRAGIHYYNTSDELERAIAALKTLASS